MRKLLFPYVLPWPPGLRRQSVFRIRRILTTSDMRPILSSCF